MLTEILTGLVVEGAAGFLTSMLKESLIERAASTTASEFRHLEGLRDALVRWAKSDSLAALTARIRSGEQGLLNDDIVSSFVESSGLYTGEPGSATADAVVSTFLQRFMEELYKSEEGVPLLASRIEKLHAESVAAHRSQIETLSAKVDAIAFSRRTSSHCFSSYDPEPGADDERTYHARVDEARALIRSGKPTSTRSILLRLRAETSHRRVSAGLRFRIATNLGACALSSVSELIADVAEIWPGDPQGLLVTARQRRREGDTASAIDLLVSALPRSAGGLRDRIALELGQAYFPEGRYPEAAEALGMIVEDSEDNPISRMYLVSLFHSGRYGQALSLAQGIRAGGKPIPVVSDVESHILAYIGDFGEAKSLEVGLSEMEPENAARRLHAALYELHMGNVAEARRLLGTIAVEDFDDDPELLMQTAKARAFLEMDNVLPFAYRARRLGFHQPDIHLSYLVLFHGRETQDQDLLNVSTVAAGCAVTLRSGDETKHFVVSDELLPNRERGELASSDPLATRLLGLRRRDSVVLRDTPLEHLSYEVIDIESKYTHALRETVSNFSTWFPDHQGLFRIRLQDSGLEKISMMVDVRQKAFRDAISLNRERRLPLGTLAILLGCSLVDAWVVMTADPEGRITASDGGVEVVEREAGLLASTNAVVIDLSSLLTLVGLGVAESVLGNLGDVYVAQAVLDDIVEDWANARLQPKASPLVTEGAQQHLNQGTAAVGPRSKVEFLEAVRDVATSRARLVPARAILEIGKAEFEKTAGRIGRAAAASMLLAHELKTPLCSDDLALRSLATSRWDVTTLWSQSLLRHLRERGLLSADDYHKAIAGLVALHYGVVSVEAEDLLWALEENDMRITTEVATTFSALSDPDLDGGYATQVSAELLRLIWSRTPSRFHRTSALDLVLRALTTGRLGPGAVRALKREVGSRFLLAPLTSRELITSIDLWQRGMDSLLKRPTRPSDDRVSS